MKERLLYSVREAAEQLSVSKTTVFMLIAQGQVKHRRFGRRMLIPRAELERLAAKDFPKIWPKEEAAS